MISGGSMRIRQLPHQFGSRAVVMVLLIANLCSTADAQSVREAAIGSGLHGRSAWEEEASEFNIEAITLYAIALVESRRPWTDGLVRPWPWTLHTPTEKDMYFPTYESALAKLRQILAGGETNVDVGLLQINWRANAYRLPDAAELLIPRNNMHVGAQVLREALDRCGGDWSCAVARYHSPREDLGSRYAAAVRGIAERLRRMPAVLDALAQ